MDDASSFLDRLLGLRPHWVLLLYVGLDTLCVGAGMGVPFFCILLGFPVGWYLARRLGREGRDVREALRDVLIYGILTSGLTLLDMLVIWGKPARMLFDPEADLGRFGIPMILFEPRASFIAWILLMVVVSPFLQLLTTLFAAQLTLLRRAPGEPPGETPPGPGEGAGRSDEPGGG